MHIAEGVTSFPVALPPLSFASNLQDPQQQSQSTPDTSFSSHMESASSSDSASTQDSDTTSLTAARLKAHDSRNNNEKAERPKSATGNAATLLGTQAPYQQVLDDRKLQLALERNAGQDQSQKGTAGLNGAAADASTKVASANASASSSANPSSPSKGGVAFGANLHMDATQLSENAMHKGTQAVGDAKNKGGNNHPQGSRNSNDDADKKDLVAPPANSVPTAAIAHAAPAIHHVSPFAAPEQAQAAYAANAASRPIAAAPAAVPTPVLDTPVPASNSKSIDFQVGSADDNAVNVRVSQRAGDMQVTVRTPDTDLAQSLRQHLPELSDRLSQSGVHSDLWQPTTSSATNDQSSDTGTGTGTGEEAAQGQNPNSDAQSNQKQQDKNQSAWLKQMYDAEPNH